MDPAQNNSNDTPTTRAEQTLNRLLEAGESPLFRDLAWSLLSPEIIKLSTGRDTLWESPHISAFLQQNSTHDALRELAKNSSENKKLGFYFESLIEFYLSHSEIVEHLHSHQIISADKRTLGELDYLYKCRNDAGFTHLEVTVKFFLALQQSTQPEQWIGLNPADNLANKVTRMTERQLRLTERDECRQWLNAKGIQVNKVLSIFRGRLFYPWEAYKAGCFSYPAQLNSVQLNPAHLKGWWLALEQLNSCEEADTAGTTRLQVLQRHQWLAPLAESDGRPETALCPATLQRQLQDNKQQQPLMVARWQQQQDTARWREADRGIIVPGGWPY